MEGFVDHIINVPVIGVAGALLKDWMPLLDEYYYCEFRNSVAGFYLRHSRTMADSAP